MFVLRLRDYASAYKKYKSDNSSFRKIRNAFCYTTIKARDELNVFSDDNLPNFKYTNPI